MRRIGICWFILIAFTITSQAGAEDPSESNERFAAWKRHFSDLPRYPNDQSMRARCERRQQHYIFTNLSQLFSEEDSELDRYLKELRRLLSKEDSELDRFLKERGKLSEHFKERGALNSEQNADITDCMKASLEVRSARESNPTDGPDNTTTESSDPSKTDEPPPAYQHAAPSFEDSNYPPSASVTSVEQSGPQIENAESVEMFPVRKNEAMRQDGGRCLVPTPGGGKASTDVKAYSIPKYTWTDETGKEYYYDYEYIFTFYNSCPEKIILHYRLNDKFSSGGSWHLKHREAHVVKCRKKQNSCTGLADPPWASWDN